MPVTEQEVANSNTGPHQARDRFPQRLPILLTNSIMPSFCYFPHTSRTGLMCERRPHKPERSRRGSRNSELPAAAVGLTIRKCFCMCANSSGMATTPQLRPVGEQWKGQLRIVKAVSGWNADIFLENFLLPQLCFPWEITSPEGP